MAIIQKYTIHNLYLFLVVATIEVRMQSAHTTMNSQRIMGLA